jgi:hypothetical protein
MEDIIIKNVDEVKGVAVVSFKGHDCEVHYSHTTGDVDVYCDALSVDDICKVQEWVCMESDLFAEEE